MASAWGVSWGAYWGNSWGVISARREQHAGRKRRKSKKKVFVELDGEILLFDSSQQAYDYLQSVKQDAPIKSAKTGRKVKTPAVVTKEVKEPERIPVNSLVEYVTDERLLIDVRMLIKKLDFNRLLELMEQIEEENIILLLSD